jgi:hypothetical protein
MKTECQSVFIAILIFKLVLKGIFELCASKNVYVDEIQYVKSLKNHSHKMSSTCVEAIKLMVLGVCRHEEVELKRHPLAINPELICFGKEIWRCSTNVSPKFIPPLLVSEIHKLGAAIP